MSKIMDLSEIISATDCARLPTGEAGCGNWTAQAGEEMTSVARLRSRARGAAFEKCMAALGLDAENVDLHAVFISGFNSGQKYASRRWKVSRERIDKAKEPAAP